MKKSLPSNPKILIPLFTGIGNAVLLTAMIRTIKKKIPNSLIDLVVDKARNTHELFLYDEDINQIHFYSKKWKPIKYDFHFHQFQGGHGTLLYKMGLMRPKTKFIVHYHPTFSFKNVFLWSLAKLLNFSMVEVIYVKHELFLNLSLLKHLEIDEKDFVLSPSLGKKTLIESEKQIQKLSLPKEYILLQPAVAFNKPSPKAWPFEYWIRLIQKIIENRGKAVVLLGSPSEVELGEKLKKAVNHHLLINLIGKTTLTELIGVIQNAECIIAGDSSVAHISSSLDKNTLVLWGASNFTKNHPIGRGTEFVHLQLSCSPCIGDPKLYPPEKAHELCPYDIKCMKLISPDMVFNAYIKHFSAFPKETAFPKPLPQFFPNLNEKKLTDHQSRDHT